MVDIDALASPAYRATLREMHAERPWGDEGLLWVDMTLRLAREVGAQSVLDYGCGRGTFATRWHRKSEIPVFEYDPGIEGKEALPVPVDIVVASDVLEHVEPEKLSAVLDHIFGLARKAVFLVVACRSARAVLPDGRNAHLVVQTPDWWRGRLARKGWAFQFISLRKGRALLVNATRT
jgi:hypothetical protein